MVTQLPSPPKDIERWLERKANAFGGRFLNVAEANHPWARASSRNDVDSWLERTRREAREFGYPVEAVTAEVLGAIYNARMARRRQEFIRMGWDKADDLEPEAEEHLKRVMAYDPGDVDAAARRDWKAAYLRRLSAREGMDLYIQAYMKAWDLRPEDVFPGSD